MVTVSLRGGTGNQLWQRAFGYALEVLGNEVVFDRIPLDNDDTRAYTLNHWNCEVPFGPRCGRVITEPDLRYHPELLKNYTEDVILDGYWQCPRYLEGVDVQVRRAFTLREQPNAKTLAIAREIENSESCCLHVRRTDTLNASGVVNHGLVSGEYYGRAIDYVAARVQQPHFFVFSDDIAWCKKNVVEFGHPVTFVDHNTTGVTVLPDNEVRKTDNGTEHEDLFLMSKCKHGITANSSFSWWGAWLIENQQKICISPKQWFAPSSPHDATDMFPSEWARL